MEEIDVDEGQVRLGLFSFWGWVGGWVSVAPRIKRLCLFFLLRRTSSNSSLLFVHHTVPLLAQLFILAIHTAWASQEHRVLYLRLASVSQACKSRLGVLTKFVIPER